MNILNGVESPLGNVSKLNIFIESLVQFNMEEGEDGTICPLTVMCHFQLPQLVLKWILELQRLKKIMCRFTFSIILSLAAPKYSSRIRFKLHAIKSISDNLEMLLHYGCITNQENNFKKSFNHIHFVPWWTVLHFSNTFSVILQ